ncbi:hypothetical protein cypCar_00049489 [Cyprinus carpio]|nr:hypothetical protein cypCar_00049489 [Cyprinus carpio]
MSLKYRQMIRSTGNSELTRFL